MWGVFLSIFNVLFKVSVLWVGVGSFCSVRGIGIMMVFCLKGSIYVRFLFY